MVPLPSLNGCLDQKKNHKLEISSYIEEGWFDTRDVGYLDTNEFLCIAGCRKEVINRGGELISDFQVEEGGLLSLPARTQPLQCHTHLATFILIVTERERGDIPVPKPLVVMHEKERAFNAVEGIHLPSSRAYAGLKWVSMLVY